VTNKEIIQEVNRTLNEGNTETFLAYCGENVRWNMMGTPALVGKDAMRSAMELMEADGNLPHITVKQVIAEGEIVVSEGTITMTRISGEQYHAAYCDIYQFQSGKIQELSSYIVDIDSNESEEELTKVPQITIK